jgi:predicted Zn-dependent protease
VSARQTRLDDGAPVAARESAEAAALRQRGLEFGYNLDHEQALAAFREAIAADPAHPAAYRLIAASMWIHLLFEQGAVTVEDYLAETRSKKRRAPARDVDALFRAYITRALALAEDRRRARPADALDVIARLQQRYPRNRLLWLEQGSTALRAGRAEEANQAIEDGLAKLAADAQDWVRGRAHIELGRLADLAGERTRAVDEYRVAARLCGADRDSACVTNASTLVTTRHR